MWTLFLLIGALLHLTAIVSKNIVHVYNVHDWFQWFGIWEAVNLPMR